MAVVAGWGWRQRIRHRHFRHWWYMRIHSDSALECTRCHAIKPDDRPFVSIPSSDELDIIKENNNVLAVAQRVLKALAAAVSAGLASYGVAVADGTVAGDEWVTLVIAAIGAGLVVWAVPNKETA